MKKYIFLAIASLLLVLTACSDEDETTKEMYTEINDANFSDDEEAEKRDTEANDADTNQESKEKKSDDKVNQETNDELGHIKEGSTIQNEIDVTKLSMEKKTDTNEKRILLFVDDNQHKKYKTIYLKHKNFLKIIDVQNENNDNGLIFKGQVD